MRQIGVPRLWTLKGHHEPVGESIVEALIALVGATQNLFKAWDLANHALECTEAIIDLLRGNLWLKLEDAEVFDL